MYTIYLPIPRHIKGQCDPQSQREKQLTETDLEKTQILELAHKDFQNSGIKKKKPAGKYGYNR